MNPERVINLNKQEEDGEIQKSALSSTATENIVQLKMTKRGRPKTAVDPIMDAEKQAKREKEVFEYFKNLKITIPSKDGSNEEEVSFTEDEAEKLSKRATFNLSNGNYQLSVIPDYFAGHVTGLNVTPNEWKKACLKSQNLFFHDPTNTTIRVDNLSNILGVDKKTVLASAISKGPGILWADFDKIKGNIDKSSQLLGVSKEKFINMALIRPQLLYQLPETINGNVEKIAQTIEINKQDFLNLVASKPEIFTLSPEKIGDNISGSSKVLEMTKEEFIALGLRSPQLLYSSPSTIEDHYNLMAAIFGGDKKRAKQKIIDSPSSLTYGSARINIHSLLFKLAGLEKHISTDPEELLRRYYDQNHNPEEWEYLRKLIGHINVSEKEKKDKEMAEKNKNKVRVSKKT